MPAWNKLTAAAVKNHKSPGRYGDGGGLWLQVTAANEDRVTRSWLFRYMRAGRAREMGLGQARIGSEGTVTLEHARRLAQQAREQLADGLDPIEARKAKRQAALVEQASRLTFKQSAEKFIAAQKDGWSNEKHAAQVAATLDRYAYPILGDLPVSAIDTGLVMKCLQPIWAKKTETASRVRMRIEAVLNWATAHGHRRGENPARWRGHLDKLLPARSKVAPVEHFAALPYAEVSAFVAAVRGQEGIAARALEFAILTACRTGEAIRAVHSEFDLDAKIWTIPKERTKSRRAHKVPLSDRAVEIIRTLPTEEGSEFVFAGARSKKPLSQMSLLMTLRRMKREDLTVHGFRSTFRDWAAEMTSFPSEVVEMALGHVVDDKVEAAYRRGDLFEKRRRLMAAWSDYVAAEPARKGKNVTTIRARA